MKRDQILVMLALAGLSVALGFVAWWAFVPLAFVAAFALSRLSFARAVVVSCAGPALGWLLACAVRDVYEDGRISVKLASLLHVRFAFAVYIVVVLVTLVPAFFAAYSGAKTSEALR